MLLATTGLSIDEREAIETEAKLLNSSINLLRILTRDCTHLIYKTTESKKVEYAKKWNIKLVEYDKWKSIIKKELHGKTSINDQKTIAKTDKKSLKLVNGFNDIKISDNPLFNKWVFCCDPLFDSTTLNILVKSIKENKGKVVNKLNTRTITSFLLVPFTSGVHVDKPYVATELWIEACLDAERLLDLNEEFYFKPFSRPLNIRFSLEKLYVAVTGFSAMNKHHYRRVLREYGGIISDDFSKQNTHLIVQDEYQDMSKEDITRRNQKILKAKSWNIPVVDKQWLDLCVLEATIIDIKNFEFQNPQISQQNIEFSNILSEDVNDSNNHSFNPDEKKSKIHIDEDHLNDQSENKTSVKKHQANIIETKKPSLHTLSRYNKLDNDCKSMNIVVQKEIFGNGDKSGNFGENSRIKESSNNFLKTSFEFQEYNQITKKDSPNNFFKNSFQIQENSQVTKRINTSEFENFEKRRKLGAEYQKVQSPIHNLTKNNYIQPFNLTIPENQIEDTSISHLIPREETQHVYNISPLKKFSPILKKENTIKGKSPLSMKPALLDSSNNLSKLDKKEPFKYLSPIKQNQISPTNLKVSTPKLLNNNSKPIFQKLNIGKFECTQFLNALTPQINSSHTPATNKSENIGIDTPMCSRGLQNALQNIQVDEIIGMTEEWFTLPNFIEGVSYNEILKGVRISISQKLFHKRECIQNMVLKLGGEFSGTNIDSKCTHFIHLSNTKHETFDSFRKAKTFGLFIVSPFWIRKCALEGIRVSEISYPHDFQLLSSSINEQKNPLIKPKITEFEEILPTFDFGEPVFVEKDIPTKVVSKTELIQEDEEAVFFDDLEGQCVTREIMQQLFPMDKKSMVKEDGKNEVNDNSVKVEKSLFHSKTSMVKKEIVDKNSTSEGKQVDDKKSVVIQNHDKKSVVKEEVIIQNIPKKVSKPIVSTNKTIVADDNKKRTDQDPSKDSSRNNIMVTNQVNEAKKENLEKLKFLLNKSKPTQTIIMMSCMEISEKKRISQDKYIMFNLSKLDGFTILDSAEYDNRCTHLIIGQANRSGKILAHIAAGRWIVKPSFAYECLKMGCLVSEEKHEWQPSTEYTKEMNLVIESSKRWRLHYNHTGHGAFHGWQVYLLLQDSKSVYESMFKAGGSIIISDKRAKTITHFIIDDKEKRQEDKRFIHISTISNYLFKSLETFN